VFRRLLSWEREPCCRGDSLLNDGATLVSDKEGKGFFIFWGLSSLCCVCELKAEAGGF